jgi:hypothetical protein
MSDFSELDHAVFSGGPRWPTITICTTIDYQPGPVRATRTAGRSGLANEINPNYFISQIDIRHARN